MKTMMVKNYYNWNWATRQLVLLIMVLLVISSLALARRPNNSRSDLHKTMSRPLPEFKAHTIGTIWQVVTNYGSFGDPNFETTARPSLEWPAGKKSSYLYDGSIWVSTILNGEKWNSAYFYSLSEWEPSEGESFLMGNDEVAAVTSPISIQDSWAVFDDMAPDTDHEPLGIRVVRHGLSWSMPEYDDFVAYQFDIINTGLNGDLREVYISFWYDCDVASVDVSDHHIDDLVDYDGWDGNDTNTDELDIVDPLDIDGDGETGYDAMGIPFADQRNVPSDGGDIGYQPDRIEPDGIFDEYTLLLDPNGPVLLADVGVTIGEHQILAGEPLLNNNGVEIYGYKIPRNMSYIYDADNSTSSDNDMGERDLSPPSTGYIAGRMIYADPTPSDYLFDNPDSIYQRIPRSYSHQWWNWESDPDNDAEVYDYITGQHEFSQGYQFLPNPFDVGAPAFDYRFLHSVGPYDIASGDTVHLVWAEGVGEGLGGLREIMDNAFSAYYEGSEWSTPYNPSDFRGDKHWVLPTPPVAPNLRYSPGENGVKLVWDNISEITPDTKSKIIDFAGYKVYRAVYSPSSWTLIDVMFDIGQFEGDTLYYTDTEGDTLGSVLKSEAKTVVNFYEDTGGVTAWGDTVPVPITGLPYYYSVIAFDTGDPDANLPASESGKSNYKKNDAGAPIPVFPKRNYDASSTFDLSSVNVVPNPYKGTGQFENVYESKLMFTGLPPAAKITIYSLAGDLIISIFHEDGTDIELWDMLSRNGQAVISGLYLYVVEADDDKVVGKFVIVR